MKFCAVFMMLLCLSFGAKADILLELLDLAVARSGVPLVTEEKETSSATDTAPAVAAAGALSVGGVAGYNMAMARYQANEILNTASMLAILAMSSNGGEGKETTLAESGLPNSICGVDMVSSKDGVVTMTFGEDCKTQKGEDVHISAVISAVKEVGKERISCEGKRCQLNFNVSSKGKK